MVKEVKVTSNLQNYGRLEVL